MANATKQMKQQKAGQAQELDEIRALYQKEVVQRKMLYNQVCQGGVGRAVQIIGWNQITVLVGNE